MIMKDGILSNLSDGFNLLCIVACEKLISQYKLTTHVVHFYAWIKKIGGKVPIISLLSWKCTLL